MREAGIYLVAFGLFENILNLATNNFRQTSARQQTSLEHERRVPRNVYPNIGEEVCMMIKTVLLMWVWASSKLGGVGTLGLWDPALGLYSSQSPAVK